MIHVLVLIYILDLLKQKVDLLSLGIKVWSNIIPNNIYVNQFRRKKL